MGMHQGTADKFPEDWIWRDRDEAGNARQSGVNSGDGFMVIEEYRGFYVGGIHTRLHPEYKDVFIRSFVGQNEIGHARNLPMTVRSINENEWDGRHVNFCKGGIGDPRRLQRPIHIWGNPSPIPENPDTVIFGECNGPAWGPFTPNNSDCVIYTVRIRDYYNADADAILPIVIAHEAGHAVNLEHHSLVLNEADEVIFPVANSDVCVMVNPVENAATYIRWAGTRYAHTHNTPPGGDPPDGDDWEDHSEKYKLHSNHGGQRTYAQD